MVVGVVCMLWRYVSSWLTTFVYVSEVVYMSVVTDPVVQV